MSVCSAADVVRMQYLEVRESTALIWCWCTEMGKYRRVLSEVNSLKTGPDVNISVKGSWYEVLPGESIRGRGDQGKTKEVSQTSVHYLRCNIVEQCHSMESQPLRLSPGGEL